MSAFSDLDPFTLFLDDPAVLAVGWIDAQAGYPTGPTDPAAFEKLVELCKAPWTPLAAAGFHRCRLCQYDGPPMKNEIYIPGRGCIYAAPTGIVHYVAAHRYQPPPVFIDAVLACPPMRSMDYKRALLANGGRALLKAGRQ
jgi:hypothetical protein